MFGDGLALYDDSGVGLGHCCSAATYKGAKSGYTTRVQIHALALASVLALTMPAAAALSLSHEEKVVVGAARLVAWRFNAGEEPFALPVPGLLRSVLPQEAVELWNGTGACDSAARSLMLLLDLVGIESKQVNIAVSRGAGHSATTVQLDGRDVYVDPFYGVAAVAAEGSLSSIEDLVAAMRGGVPAAQALMPLRSWGRHDGRENLGWYQQWSADRVFHAVNGADAGILVDLPLLGDADESRVGELDGTSSDLAEAGPLNGMTTFFHYLGNRYDRAWTRTVQASETIVFEITTVETADRGNINAVPPPTYVVDNRIRWVLGPGESVTLLQTGVTGRQEVDMIRIMRPAQLVREAAAGNRGS